jgi:uncharacterized protein with NAD-binding domain and iron-sulfur cluster
MATDVSEPASPVVTRRRFVRDAGLASLAVADLLGAPALAGPPGRRGQNRPTVAVLGGGIAGLTAAHELAERGFDVTVYERNAPGGMARSFPIPHTAAAGRRPLPGEHGWRTFHGFYHNMFDTMRRIPFAGNPNGTRGNLLPARDPLLERSGGREGRHLFVGGAPEPVTVESLQRYMIGTLELASGIPPDEVAFFARQFTMYLTSSDERRIGQWEYVSASDYLQSQTKSDEYRAIFDRSVRVVAALKSKDASARAAFDYLEALVLNGLGRGAEAAPLNFLTAPTNEALIDPWILHLRAFGVRLRVGRTVEALNLRRGRIVSARVRDPHGRRHDVEAEWFVCALPVERARRLWSREILAADPRLERMNPLRTDGFYNGIQLYLRQEVPIDRGAVAYLDSPWALSSVSHGQFWPGRDFARDYGDGQASDSLSAIIAAWDVPGILYGKPARECTPEQVAHEVTAQIKAHLEDTGRSYLPDGIVHSWSLDPGIGYPRRGPLRARNDTPPFPQIVGSWDNRPETQTAIPNLFLAGAGVRTQINVWTMEGANESGRRAANDVLTAAGSRAEPARVFSVYKPPEFEAAKRADAERYRRGQPHILDTPWPDPRQPDSMQ